MKKIDNQTEFEHFSKISTTKKITVNLTILVKMTFKNVII